MSSPFISKPTSSSMTTGDPFRFSNTSEPIKNFRPIVVEHRRDLKGDHGPSVAESLEAADTSPHIMLSRTGAAS